MHNKVTSLTRYINLRITTLMLIVTLCWIGIAKYSYEFAQDDSATHYLFYDAERAVKHLYNLPYTDDFKLITQNPSDLSEDIFQTWQSGQLTLNEVTLVQQKESDVYVLPWQQQNSVNPPIFVLHYFDKQDDVPILPWLLLMMSALSIPALIVVIRSTLRIKKQINNLSKLTSNNKQFSEKRSFQEFIEFAQALKVARQAEHYAQQKERLLSTYLSHEVRTPLTQIQHGISRLQQVDDIPLEAVDVLATLEQAQARLNSTSQAVLALWQQAEVEKQPVDITQLIKSITMKLDPKRMLTHLECTPQPVFIALHNPLTELLVTQAIENAKRHGKAPLTIKLSETQLIFANDYNEQDKTSGTGLGHMLIKQVCQRLGWHMEIAKTKSKFTLIISFIPEG